MTAGMTSDTGADADMLREFERCQALIERRLDGLLRELGSRLHRRGRAGAAHDSGAHEPGGHEPGGHGSGAEEPGGHAPPERGAGAEEGYAKLLESMGYSLLAGGKRIRPVICVKFCEAAGGDPETALDAACAIEMLHTYSLIHDDLPCMDDDDYRRGKLSNHAKYGEFVATLAGDALQAAAFETLVKSNLPPERIVAAAAALSEAAGAHGICGGQYLDLSGEGKPLSRAAVEKIHSLKTAALISAAAKIGVIAAGGTARQTEAAERYANAVGLAFQVRDDVLDVTAAQEELGKPVGSDKDNNKTTFCTLLGADECEEIIRSETEKAAASLHGKFADASFLIWLAGMLAERKY